MHLAKPEIVKEERCFLVEGYTDVMAMHQAGVTNVVSSSGTALTTGQIHLIRRYTKHVTVIFDGDAAGIRASLRGIDMLLSEGMSVKVVLLPDGDDPDTYAKKVGSDALHRAIHDDAQDFLQFKAQLLSDEAGTDPLKRAEMIRSVVTSIASIPDAIQRSVYLQSSATQLKMDETVLGTEVAKVLHEQSKAAAKRAARTSPHGQPGSHPGAPQPSQAPHPSEAPMPGVLSMEVVPHVYERAVIENDLIRALIEYAADMVPVTLEGEDGAEPSTMEVPFAELVIHRLEEEDIAIKEAVNQTVVKRFSEELDHERILTADQLATDQDVGLQQKVAGALVQQHVLSPNWSNRHKIYPVVERDQLTLLEDSLRRLHLIDFGRRPTTYKRSWKLAAWIWMRSARCWPKKSASTATSGRRQRILAQSSFPSNHERIPESIPRPRASPRDGAAGVGGDRRACAGAHRIGHCASRPEPCRGQGHGCGQNVHLGAFVDVRGVGGGRDGGAVDPGCGFDRTWAGSAALLVGVGIGLQGFFNDVVSGSFCCSKAVLRSAMCLRWTGS